MHSIQISPEEVFQALSDSSRVRLLQLLTKIDERACLTDLAEALQEPEYKLSRHLKVLKQAGLITAERDGRHVFHAPVTSSPFLKSVISSLKFLPDDNEHYERDLERWEEFHQKTAAQSARAANPLFNASQKKRSK